MCVFVCFCFFFFSREPGRRGIGCQLGINVGRVDSLVFTLALIFVRILTLFFYWSPEMWVQESLEGVGGGVIERKFLKTLLKNIDFNDYSHIYPCKNLFL